ncbi:MAG: SDR family NAD(P)-dependent oxidoreductase [Methyloligellaceae bacterium]
MTKLMQLKDKTAVVTGAASGIGRATAISLAKRGCHVALADINAEGLNETVKLLSSYPIKVSSHILDVSNPAAIKAFPSQILAEHPEIDILVNNAGVSAGGTFEMVSEEDFEWVININFWGVVHMTRAFLPILKRSTEARLVNVSSIFGIIAPPGHTAYAASKFAVRGFSQSLRHELLDTNVGVTVVHPGGVASSIADNARIPSGATEEMIAEAKAEAKDKLTLSPEAAGETLVQGIEQRKARVLIGKDAKFISIIERFKPVFYWNTLSKIAERRRTK